MSWKLEDGEVGGEKQKLVFKRGEKPLAWRVRLTNRHDIKFQAGARRHVIVIRLVRPDGRVLRLPERSIEVSLSEVAMLFVLAIQDPRLLLPPASHQPGRPQRVSGGDEVAK